MVAILLHHLKFVMVWHVVANMCFPSALEVYILHMATTVPPATLQVVYQYHGILQSFRISIALISRVYSSG